MVEEVRDHVREMLESRHHKTKSKCLVQCCHASKEERWWLMFLHQFPMLEHSYEEGFLPITPNTRGARELSRHRSLSCLDLKSGFWQIKMDEASKQYTAFTVGNLGFYKCNRMPFRLCNVLATFQRHVQNCMGELNFIYC